MLQAKSPAKIHIHNKNIPIASQCGSDTRVAYVSTEALATRVSLIPPLSSAVTSNQSTLCSFIIIP